MSQVSVLIVDDHAGFRGTARELLARAGFVVVGEADLGRGALIAAANLRPAVVLLDVRLPDLDGFEVARRLMAGPYPPAIVLISTHEATDYGPRIHECGAIGFITKSSLSADTLRVVLRGNGEVVAS